MKSEDNAYPDLSSENKDLWSEGSGTEDEDALAEMTYENEYPDEDEGPAPDDPDDYDMEDEDAPAEEAYASPDEADGIHSAVAGDMKDEEEYEDSLLGNGNANGARQASVTPDIAQAVEDAQLLVAYVSREGQIDFDVGIVRTLIQSKYLLEQNRWNAEAELRFWKAHDDMASQIKPVTIDSLKWTMPSIAGLDPSKGKKKRTRADGAALKYRLITYFSLILLLVCQIYSVIGSDVTQRLGDLLKEMEAADLNVTRLKEVQAARKTELPGTNLELIDAKEKHNDLKQEFEASFDFLVGWNSIWLAVVLKGAYPDKAPPYIRNQYEENMKAFQKQIKDLEEKPGTPDAVPGAKDEMSGRLENVKEEMSSLTYQYGFDNDRRRFFINKNTAEFVLRAMNIYFLPLLYGLLGAATFVLRSLSIAIKELTFSYDSDIKYQLRLSLGALAGMAVGWFLKPEELESLGSISPMALAFLMGYNVEVLFSIMDRFIGMATRWIPENGKNRKQGGPLENQKPAV